MTDHEKGSGMKETAQERFDRLAADPTWGQDSQYAGDPELKQEVIRITYTVADVLDIATEHGIDLNLAMQRAEEWAKHITSTASELCWTQLEACVKDGQP